MKLTKDINYSIVIFFSIFLIFMDAYEFFSIPVSWIGMSLLFLIYCRNFTESATYPININYHRFFK